MDHSIQTPPYAILIFTQNEIKAILEFSLATFLRHFSLYEFAFKPRVDLILRSDPIINEKFNSRLESLDEMEIVDKTEVDRLKAFLGLGEADLCDPEAGHLGAGHEQAGRRYHPGRDQWL